MELTKEQIQQIENYLTRKKVDYIDLKIEILDHMIIDVESRMKENHSFETAFYQTKYKWNTHFKSSSSFYFGILFSVPKIILNKATKEFRFFYLAYLVAYFLPLIILSQFEFTVTKTDAFNFIHKIISFIVFIYMFYIIYNIWKSKVKTTYSFILKTQYLGVVFLMFLTFIGGGFSNIFISLSSAGIMAAYTCHHFYKKHFNEIRKNEKQLLCN